MMLIGVDYHPSFQTIAFFVEETGECGEQELNHSDGQAEKFYRDLQQRGIRVRVGIEATGYSHWFERLLAELDFELWMGDPAEIKAKRVKKQKFDREDARLILRLMRENNFPQIWVPGPENRDLRQLLWHRHRLVQMRTRIMNQLQALAMNEGYRWKKKLFSEQGRVQLEKLALAPWASRRRQELLELLDRMNPTIEEFKTVIEQRKSLVRRTNLTEADLDRLDKSLKVLANATSYGIFAEMNRQETEKKTKVQCHGLDPEPFTCLVLHPEQPGEFCFPPLASLITGGARLMLALAEHSVSKAGGTYAMEDTDSMAIVSTKKGGYTSAQSETSGIEALSWKQVDKIVRKFEALNPYDRKIISGSILKIEDDNFDPQTGKQRQLHCLAISAKRYALFVRLKNGEPVLLREKKNNKKDRWSRHGLGHLLNPSDPEASDRNWTAAVWDMIVRKSCGLKTKKVTFADLPAIGRTTVSSPGLMNSFESLNRGKPYAEQVKPFNFLQTAHVIPEGHPNGVDPEKFHLVKPYDPDPRKWLEQEWIDQHSKKKYRITTRGNCGTRWAARVKTYGELITEYEFHPESKCADASGNPCGRQTTGQLQRRHIKVDEIKCIGKESNSLESVDEGMIHSDKDVSAEYLDPKRSEWVIKIQPALRQVP